jgi:hypothetical protein
MGYFRKKRALDATDGLEGHNKPAQGTALGIQI